MRFLFLLVIISSVGCASQRTPLQAVNTLNISVSHQSDTPNITSQIQVTRVW